MKSIDVGRDFSGQLAGGHILNVGICPGKDNCPYERSEAELARRFEQTTGITCSGGARKALEHLLETGVFDYKQLEFAWRKKTVWWDLDSKLLTATVNQVDLWYGLCLIWAGALLFLATMIGMIVIRGGQPLTTENMTILATGVLFLSAAPFAEKHLVRPSRIAKRVKPFLEEYYAQPH